MKTKFNLTILIFVLIFTACSNKEINTNFKNRHVKSNYSFKNYKGDKLKLNVLLVADNQFNNIFQDPSIMRNNIADKLSNVSIRPPQLDIYSNELFKFALKKNNADKNYMIHLGDALNIACENEWITFTDTLTKANIDKNKFVMAPGNHDFYWFGTTAGFTESIKVQWGKSCSDVYPIKEEEKPTNKEYLSKRMTKGKFIKSYLQFLNLNLDINISDNIDENLSNRFIKRIYVKRFLKKEEDDYKSFILQLIEIPTKDNKVIKGIIIDTANYNKKPLNLFGLLSINDHENAGLTAGITQEQFNTIKTWIKDINQTDQNQQYIIFGHHPLNQFQPKIKEAMKKILKDKNALAYISAHTHLGYVEEENNETNITEINVGSITDYPNEIRTLESNDNDKLISKSILITPYDVNSIYCKAKYDYSASFPNYTSYELAGMGIDTAHKVHEKILDISIKTLLREFDNLNNSKYSNECIQIKIDAKDILEKKIKCNNLNISKKDRIKYNNLNILEEDTIKYDSKLCFNLNKKLRHNELEILKELIKCRKNNIKNDSNLNNYGVCQSLWSTKAEWINNNTK